MSTHHSIEKYIFVDKDKNNILIVVKCDAFIDYITQTYFDTIMTIAS